ncbi:Cytochrome c oxidase polypeptide II [Enhygromyxa salina]|uniref:Cytochrome c oxidase subunit 2 n=1 Tax=Enhygromyxa salina TaxID=215803 RepID=A0A0C2D4L3_9BACT|nr:cytochrome c oxidase subunit II [Enhygromyxa salina]KIG15027.1 Cytochrome c oxidase polypeptide II [Enhygromyxa salina]
MSETPWELLPTASNHAASLDGLYVFLTIVCGISFVLVIGAMLYFMVKYKKRSDNDRTSPLTHSGKLEFAWSAIPAVFLMLFFVWGELDFVKLSAPPADAIDIRVTGQKWYWTIEYPGRPVAATVAALDGEVAPLLVVPLNQPVRLLMTSKDVIHSFYIPAFRVKKDVVPGRYASVWFTAIEEGTFPVFCTEYCGDEHSSMLAIVKVVPADQYEEAVRAATTLEQGEGETVEQFGEKVYKSFACNSCHNTDSTAKVGPGFGGVFGKSESFTDGSSGVVDENYIRESIYSPNAKVVSGFTPQMPSFAGQINDDQMNALIAYIKSLK